MKRSICSLARIGPRPTVVKRTLLSLTVTTPYASAGSLISPLHAVSLRLVHNTKKTDTTPLVTSERTTMAFHKMSLASLRNECRSRGLKISGKKAELVARVSSHHGFDQASTVSTKKAKIFTKKRAIHTPRRISSDIADLTAAPKMSARTMTYETIAAQKVGKDAAKLMKSITQRKVVTSTIVTNKTAKENGDEITAQDKIFFYGFVTIVGIWWCLQDFDGEKQ